MNTTSSALILALTVILAVSNLKSCLAADDDGAILVLGDSWASLSESFLAGVCSLGSSSEGSRPLTNNGISGSTAKEWASGENAVESFQKAKYDYDYVWISLGGNDFNCDKSIHDDIADNILKVITDVFESSNNDDIKVLYTGYGYPSENICGGGSGVDVTPIFDDLSTTVREKIEKSSYADKVLTIDILSLFVTKDSEPYSDKAWYADDIHINEAGYAKLFSKSELQQFFGCSGGSYDEGSPPASSSAIVSTSAMTLFALTIFYLIF